MEIAVIGTGNIGGVLGRAFARAGHSVSFGSRSPDDNGPARDSGALVTDVASALGAAKVVVLAVPGGAVESFASEYSGALSGKLIIDCANKIGGGGPANSHDVIMKAVSGARYARAFNCLGWEVLDRPSFGGVRADMFYSCAEADKAALEELIVAVGLRPAYVGEDAHEVVDGVLPLWLVLSRSRGRHTAFRVLDDNDR
ncbi:MAG TPA: NAD(P)-binding domain-containing protein [Acidimicrobiales bacterium]|nr:NAD(P)-binding domain-containing protein [Acidimicrobiales bacterium]